MTGRHCVTSYRGQLGDSVGDSSNLIGTDPEIQDLVSEGWCQGLEHGLKQWRKAMKTDKWVKCRLGSYEL
jgi:hypothetical protein